MLEQFSLYLKDLGVPSLVQIFSIIGTIGLLDIVDILIVGALFYKIYEMLQGTKAITLLKGFLVLGATTVVTSIIGLHTISWVLEKSLTILFVALPIVFQPEIRRALEEVGQGGIWNKTLNLNHSEAEIIIKEIIDAVQTFSKKHTGALIVFERTMSLDELVNKAILIDAKISAELIGNIFFVNTPLHDGAMIIRGNRIIAASSILPLTENSNLSTELGTRHRASLGLSEQCDALVLIVSEETGIISIAEYGTLTRNLDSDAIHAKLLEIFTQKENPLSFRYLKVAFTKWLRLRKLKLTEERGSNGK